MVFRDFAQGAFRMRGIGAGQTLTTFIIPEVKKLMASSLGASPGYKATPVPAQTPGKNYNDAQTLIDISAWLVLNSFKSEKVQFNTLMEQSMGNVWRKVAFQKLITDWSKVGTEVSDQFMKLSIDVFRTRIDHAVENGVPVPIKFDQKLALMVQSNAKFLSDPEQV
jgi:hypothetical protein